MSFEDHLNTGAGRSFKFETVGTKIAGTVTNKSMVNSTDFDGNPVEVPVVQIDTADGEFDVWLAKAAMRSAVGRALAEHGTGTKLEIGGMLAIERTEDGVAKKAGHNAPHLFRAQYRPPATASTAPSPASAPAEQAPSASDLFG